MEEKQVLKTKTYTITASEFEDGTSTINLNSDGFNSLEILGLANFITSEIMKNFQVPDRYNPITNDTKEDIKNH